MLHTHLPVVPVAPILNLDLPAPATAQPVPCVLDAGEVRLLTAGRLGECHALRLLGIGPGDRVLLPAYHCISMLYPILWAGAEPVYYRLHPDTSIDYEDMAAHLGAGAKAVIATHFFGFAQDIGRVRALCDAHGAALIEDCAHAFFGEYQGRPLGSFGDYAIASPVKFFPVFDGGCLISARHRLDTVQPRAGAPDFQIKAVLDPLERATLYGRLRLLGSLLYVKNALWTALKRLRGRTSGTQAPVIGPSSSGGGAELALDWLQVGMSFAARIGMQRGRRASAGIAQARRANYRRLADALCGLPGCRPLRAQLPDDTIPYVLPLLIDDPARVFPALKRARVPVLRWEDIPDAALAACPVAARYRSALLQLPCHQALRSSEIDWIAAQVRSAVLAASAAGVSA